MSVTETAPDLVDVSIVIVNWNTKELLDACLESVFKTVNSVTSDVWVVDNASSDGSVEMVRAKYPRCHLIENPINEGFGRASNQGIKASKGRTVLLLNSDVVLTTAGAIGLALSTLQNYPEVGVLGCELIGRDGTPQGNWYTHFPHGPSLKKNRVKLNHGLVEAAWVWAAFAIVRREVIEQVGGFDEDFFMFYEDVDWAWRIRDAGWRIAYFRGIKVIHECSRSVRQLPGDTYLRWRVVSECLLYYKHHSKLNYKAWMWLRVSYYRGQIFLSRVMRNLLHAEWKKKKIDYMERVLPILLAVRNPENLSRGYEESCCLAGGALRSSSPSI